MSLVPLQKKRLDAIADNAVGAVGSYPGDPLDVAHTLLCVAVETMLHQGLGRDQIAQLVAIVIDEGKTD